MYNLFFLCNLVGLRRSSWLVNHEKDMLMYRADVYSFQLLSRLKMSCFDLCAIEYVLIKN